MHGGPLAGIQPTLAASVGATVASFGVNRSSMTQPQIEIGSFVMKSVVHSYQLPTNQPTIDPSIIEFLVANMEGKEKQPFLLRT